MKGKFGILSGTISAGLSVQYTNGIRYLSPIFSFIYSRTAYLSAHKVFSELLSFILSHWIFSLSVLGCSKSSLYPSLFSKVCFRNSVSGIMRKRKNSIRFLPGAISKLPIVVLWYRYLMIFSIFQSWRFSEINPIDMPKDIRLIVVQNLRLGIRDDVFVNLSCLNSFLEVSRRTQSISDWLPLDKDVHNSLLDPRRSIHIHAPRTSSILQVVLQLRFFAKG